MLRTASSHSLALTEATSHASPFANTSSVGRLTRTYLAAARRLRLERHGKLATEIEALQQEALALDQAGKRVDAFLFKERALVLRQKLYGASHRVVTECAKDLTLQYSVVAMDLVRGGDTVESLKLLEKAQILSSSEVLFPDELLRKQLLAVLLNNFGCFYKFLSKLHTALKYLQKALSIESSVPGCHNPAGTHLNVCALLSQMGRHRSALHHAQLAIHILREERDRAALERSMGDALRRGLASRGLEGEDGLSLPSSELARGQHDSGDMADTASARAPEESSSNSTRSMSAANLTERSIAPSSGGSTAAPSTVGPVKAEHMSINRDETNKACLMVIALYNAAVEMEHLGVYADAADQYGEALQVATSELGSSHPLVESVSNAWKLARRAAAKLAKRRAAQSRGYDAVASRGCNSDGGLSLLSDPVWPPNIADDESVNGGAQVSTPSRQPRPPPPRAPSQGLPGISPRNARASPAVESPRTPRTERDLRLPAVGSSPRGATDASWSAGGGLHAATPASPRTSALRPATLVA